MGLEELAAAGSSIHRLHPLAKLVTSLVCVVAVVSFPRENVSGLMPFLLYPAVLMSLGGIPFRSIFPRLLPALAFSLMGGIGNLFILREGVFFLGPWIVTTGMVSFVSILLKTILTVCTILILAAATPFPALIRQIRFLKVPEIICLQLSMTYRYLSVLWGEAAAMSTAYMLRGGGRGIRLKDSGPFLGRLLLRSFDRAGRVYQGMQCRGFRGNYPVCETRPFRIGDGIYMVLLSGAFILLRLFNLSLFFGDLAVLLSRSFL